MCKEAALSKELRDLSFCSAVPIPGYYKNNRKRDCKRKYWKDCYGTAVFQVLIYQMNGFLSLLILVNIICCIFNISEEKENSKLVSGYLIWGEKEGIHVYGSMTEDYEDYGTIMGMLKAKDDEIKQMIKDHAKEYYENIQKEKVWEQKLKEEKEKVKELQELRNDQERRISWVHEENLRLKQQQDRGNEQLAREFEQKIKEARKEERRILEDKITQLEEKVRKYEEERFEWEFPPLERNPSMLLALEELTAEPQIKSHMANVVLETEVVRNAAEDQDAAKPKVRKVVHLHVSSIRSVIGIPKQKSKYDLKKAKERPQFSETSSEVLNYMSLVIAKVNPDYVEAKQATEEIETPSIGFAAPSEFKEGTIKTLGALIKQNNTILYLLIKQGEEVKTIREELIEVKGRLKVLEKQEAAPQEFGEAIADLTKRLEKKMSQRRVPTLFSVREGTSTDDLPTQDDQVRDYQWTQRRRFELQRGFRRLRGQRYNNTLESMVNPEQQLAISGRRRAQLAPAEVLYSYHRQTARHRVYEHYSEQRINCGEGDQVDLRLCNDQSYQALQREGMQHIHIGLAMIRIHTLHRIGAGTNALVALQDTRWSNTTRIISTMEVDLAQGTQLVYMVPDMMMSINDFHDHLRVSIQTHGYEAWQGGESNLLVTLSMVGRLSNTSYVGFNYNIENVVDHLSTRGISAIPGERRTMEELEGQSWHLRPVENETAKVPTRVAVHQRINRTTSLRFERYRSQTPSRASVDQRDQEVVEDEEEILTAAVALMESETPHQKRCVREENRRHRTYDVCFCRECLIEEENLKYNPLNVQKSSNKPRNKYKKKWSTLGEPSRKWDYYVKYDITQPTSPIEEVTATGWGDEFKDNENHNPTTKIIVPEQDSSEPEWENPFAMKRGEGHKDEKEEELPYLQFKREVERIMANEVAYPTESSTSVYNPPEDSVMGPPVYPPSTRNYQQYDGSQFQPKSQKGFKGNYGSYLNQQWSLPPAYVGIGALLVLPEDPGLWDDTISRWETITINVLNSQSWSDNKSKLLYVENLLGEQEKLMWQQWRTTYQKIYETLVGIADDPQNITSHMRTVIMMEEPYRGSTERQDIAQRDLDRLTCEDTKDLWRFMHEFRILAINSGKLYFPSTTEKYFSKLPPILSQRVQEAFKRKYPGLIAGVLPAIKFTHTFVSEMCKEAALSKELRDLSFCSAVPIPGYYKLYGRLSALIFRVGPEADYDKKKSIPL
ncbi:hypothetical protein Tco_0962107 [Tanacetum coccineum]